MSSKVLVTGAAGFIGYHLCERLLSEGHQVVGLDSLNEYYDPALKRARLERLLPKKGFIFAKTDLADKKGLERVFDGESPTHVVNLAAQAGVRYSLTHPQVYVDANVTGFLNVLENCRTKPVKHLIYASSSSVYGLNTKMPFSASDPTDHPVSLYAATKKANEMMAHAYSHLFRIPATGLRFFTVYGPWGRPDMALFIFCKAILEGKPIDVFNEGKMERDFTYVDDIVEGVTRLLEKPPQPDPSFKGEAPDPAASSAPHKIYNIGNHSPVELLHFIEVIEECLGKKAKKNLLPMQAGDVLATFADIEALGQVAGFKPSTPLKAGVARFVEWYRAYYKV